MSKPRVLLLAEPAAFASELQTKLEPHAELRLVGSVELALAAVVHTPTRILLVGAGDHTFLHANRLMRTWRGSELERRERPLVILLRHTWEPELVESHRNLELRADGYLATGLGVDSLVEQLVRCLNLPR